MTRGFRYSKVQGHLSTVYRIWGSGSYFVMTSSNGYHVGVAMADHMGKRIWFGWVSAAAACQISGRPAALCSISRQRVGTGTVDESPIAKADTSSIKHPGGTSTIAILLHCTSNFALIRFGFEIIGVSLFAMAIQVERYRLCIGRGGFVHSDIWFFCYGVAKWHLFWQLFRHGTREWQSCWSGCG